MAHILWQNAPVAGASLDENLSRGLSLRPGYISELAVPGFPNIRMESMRSRFSEILINTKIPSKT
jgi:hypothetical protein